MQALTQSPYLLYSDGQGNIFEDKTLFTLAAADGMHCLFRWKNGYSFPRAVNCMRTSGRRGIGIDKKTGEMRLCEKGWAVAAFIPPAHTGLYLAAYETMPDAPTLPLFCYTAAGWYNDQFFVPAVRIEKIYGECAGWDPDKIEGCSSSLQAYPHNRLVKHLMENCCMTYTCPAARNLALGRWECSVPVSPACNANCIGCISFQPEEESIVSTQDRLTFKPTAEEIVEFTVPHLKRLLSPIISYGQGCEGEPLLMWETIRESIIEIRKHTSRGQININTNGSNPAAVRALCEAGLNSIRVSTNSARERIYTAYYRP